MIVFLFALALTANGALAQGEPPSKPAEQIIADLMAQGNLPALAKYAQAVVDAAREKNAIIEDLREELKKSRTFIEGISASISEQQKLLEVQAARQKAANENFLKALTEERMQREKLVNDLSQLNKRSWRAWIGSAATGAGVAGGTTGEVKWALAGAGLGFVIDLLASK